MVRRQCYIIFKFNYYAILKQLDKGSTDLKQRTHWTVNLGPTRTFNPRKPFLKANEGGKSVRLRKFIHCSRVKGKGNGRHAVSGGQGKTGIPESISFK